jgi:hypothetical protein
VSFGDDEIRAIYNQQAEAARGRFRSTLGGVSEKEMEEVISNVVGLYDTWNNPQTGKTAESVLLSDIKEVVSKMDQSNLYKDLHHTKVKDLVTDVDRLNDAFQAQKEVMEKIEEVDKRILKYYQDRVGKSFSSFSAPVPIGNGLETLSQTGKVHTSVQNWKRGWGKMEEAIAKAGTTGKMQKTVTFAKVSSKGEKKASRQVTKVVGDTVGHLNNVKGEILEVGLAAILRGSMDDMVKSFEKSGVTSGEVINAGASYVSDPILGKKVTSKTDVGISFDIGKDGMKVNIGFSAKAQLKDGPTKKTSFLKSSYGKIMLRADLLDSHVEYMINNLVAHGKYSEAIQARKIVAAKMALIAVGGLEKVDEVYFIAYLDKVVSLPDMLQSMSSNPKSGLNLEIDRSGFKPAGMMATKWIRSHQTTEAIRKLSAAITGNT